VKQETDFLNLLLPSSNSIADDDFQDGGYSDEDQDSDVGDSEFIESMASLAGGQKKQIFASRGSTVLTGTDDENKINMDDLIGSLDKGIHEMKKRANMGIKGSAQTLAAPLHRIAEERVNRNAGYQRVRQELEVWDSIVQSNREEETVSFPLVEPDLQIKTAAEIVKSRFIPETPLEIQIAQMLSSSESTIQPGEELTPLEKKALEGLTAEEIKTRRTELARFRILRTNQMKKLAYQNKIKSKSYRRLVRKAKQSERVKELERMAEEDPEAAAYEIEKIESRRILERATLKHRQASKHMAELAKRAKLTTNKNVVKAVQAGLRETLEKHRELTAKVKTVSESEDEDENKIDSEEENDDEEDESYNDFASSYRKYWEAKQLETAAAAKKLTATDEIEDMFDEASFARKQALARRKSKEAEKENNKNDDKEDGEDNVEDKEMESLVLDKTQTKLLSISGTKSKRTLANPQSTIHNSDEELSDDEQQNNADKTTAENKDSDSTKPRARKAEVDPDNFIQVKPKKLKSALPEIVGYNEDSGSDSDDEQRKMIAEAFADDDVMEDFTKEKEAIIAASKAKDVDKFLPGWGAWAGSGLKHKDESYRKRFLQKAPPPVKRRDENKGNLIINTDKDKIIKQHLVSKLPDHFNSVSDFEASIRAPIGNTFIPRTAHQKLIQPRVQTKMGKSIEPIDRTVIYNKNKELIEELKLFKGQELSDDEEDGKQGGGKGKFKGKRKS